MEDEWEFTRRILNTETAAYGKGGMAVEASPEMYQLNIKECEVHESGGVNESGWGRS